MSKLILQFLKRFYFYFELMYMLEQVCADEYRCLSRAEVKVTVNTQDGHCKSFLDLWKNSLSS